MECLLAWEVEVGMFGEDMYAISQKGTEKGVSTTDLLILALNSWIESHLL